MRATPLARAWMATMAMGILSGPTLAARNPPGPTVPEALRTDRQVARALEKMSEERRRRVVDLYNGLEGDAAARKEVVGAVRTWAEKTRPLWGVVATNTVLGGLGGLGLASYLGASLIPGGIFVVTGAVIAGGAVYLADQHGLKRLRANRNLDKSLGGLERRGQASGATAGANASAAGAREPAAAGPGAGTASRASPPPPLASPTTAAPADRAAGAVTASAPRSGPEAEGRDPSFGRIEVPLPLRSVRARRRVPRAPSGADGRPRRGHAARPAGDQAPTETA